jgi:hypothetical protein
MAAGDRTGVGVLALEPGPRRRGPRRRPRDRHSAHFADLEGDGDLDFCAQGRNLGAGRVWVYEVDGSIFDPGTSRADWSMIRRDVHNTGTYPRSGPAAIADGAPATARLRCYPNPVRIGELIAPGLPGALTGRISLFDAAGRRVGGLQADGLTSHDIPVGALFELEPAPGVYFVRRDQAGGMPAETTRLVILDP